MARLLVPGYELQSMFYVCTRRLALPDCIGKLAATELLLLTMQCSIVTPALINI